MADAVIAAVDYSTFLGLSREQQSLFFDRQQHHLTQLEQENAKLKAYAKELEEKIVVIDNQLVILRNRFFGRGKRKDPAKTQPSPRKGPKKGRRHRKNTVQLPSERYPDAPLIERHVELKEMPDCSCCGSKMADSGMTENAEFIMTVPAQYMIVRQKRHKYRCKNCHGEIKTAPAPARIVAGSSYSDEMIVDVAVAKYCNLIPIERYCTIAGREGLKDLPPQSLIGVTHKLADFVEDAYDKVGEEIKAEEVVYADETPHPMLEGDEKKKWFLWGFSALQSSYFDIRDTRSGDIASEFLKEARCQYLMTDVFSAYQRAVRETNEYRVSVCLPIINHLYCNAHAKRNFDDAAEKFPEEAKYFNDRYRAIYNLERDGKDKPERLLENRRKMRPFFEEMRQYAAAIIDANPSKSLIVRACNYLLNNFPELTLFLSDHRLPIDNNHEERQLRSPVIGRKTWYGTHSKRGAKTAAILFSLVESCKLNGVNPRHYFSTLVETLHQGQDAFTPKQFAVAKANSS